MTGFQREWARPPFCQIHRALLPARNAASCVRCLSEGPVGRIVGDMERLPALFLSHGSPMLAIEDSPTGRFLDQLGETLPKPRAILVASAHYLSAKPQIGANATPATHHDFGGFPAPLYDIQYPAPGDPALATTVAQLLADAGIEASTDSQRRLDHGVWVPLRRMYPNADIPVVPLSIQPNSDASAHYRLGQALAPLREQGVLIIGSGGYSHNLGALHWGDADAPMPDWAREFTDWISARIEARDVDALFDWERQAPYARQNHPTPEHFLPLFVALGASGNDPSTRLNHVHEMGSLALDAWRFG
jgi:4,5-DOPA dioxygenase extradiol